MASTHPPGSQAMNPTETLPTTISLAPTSANLSRDSLPLSFLLYLLLGIIIWHYIIDITSVVFCLLILAAALVVIRNAIWSFLFFVLANLLTGQSNPQYSIFEEPGQPWLCAQDPWRECFRGSDGMRNFGCSLMISDPMATSLLLLLAGLWLILLY